MLLQSGPLLAAPKPTILRDLSLPRNPEERIRAHPFGGPARLHVGIFRSFVRPRRETRRFSFSFSLAKGGPAIPPSPECDGPLAGNLWTRKARRSLRRLLHCPRPNERRSLPNCWQPWYTRTPRLPIMSWRLSWSDGLKSAGKTPPRRFRGQS